MIITLKETDRSDPTQWFELCLNDHPMQIYFPSKAIFDLISRKEDLHICCGDHGPGIDLEVEEIRRLYDELNATFPEVFEAKVTKLEILMAFHDALPRLREKIDALHG